MPVVYAKKQLLLFLFVVADAFFVLKIFFALSFSFCVPVFVDIDFVCRL